MHREARAEAGKVPNLAMRENREPLSWAPLRWVALGVAGRIPVGLPPLPAVGPPAGADREHVDHALGIAASEDDAPLADAKAP